MVLSQQGVVGFDRFFMFLGSIFFVFFGGEDRQFY